MSMVHAHSRSDAPTRLAGTVYPDRSGKHGALGQARHAASNRSDLQQAASFAGTLAQFPVRGRPGCLHGPWLMDSPRGYDLAECRAELLQRQVSKPSHAACCGTAFRDYDAVSQEP